MPTSPLALCAVTGCPNLVPHGRCDEHRREARRDAGRGRPSASARGYDREWQTTRRAYLDAHPYCESATHATQPAWQHPPATDVDHIDGRGPKGPHGHDWGNLQALCHPCHSRKTAQHDGGFGRTKGQGSSDPWG